MFRRGFWVDRPRMPWDHAQDGAAQSGQCAWSSYYNGVISFAAQCSAPTHLVDGGQVVWALTRQEAVGAAADEVVEGHERAVEVLDAEVQHHLVQLWATSQGVKSNASGFRA